MGVSRVEHGRLRMADAAERSPHGHALARMCQPHMHFRSNDGTQALTIFSASNAYNQTRLWYSMDNATGGVLHKFDLVAMEMQRERRNPPTVTVCGSKVTPQMDGCNMRDHTVICHMRFEQPALCRGKGTPHMHWRNRRINAHFTFCVEAVPKLPLVFAAACAPFFLNANPSAHRPALARLTRWLGSMSAQVGRIKLHSLNHGSDVRAALKHTAVSGLVVKYWDFFEKTKSVLAASSHESNPFTQEQGTINPYAAHDLVFTKCLSEERDDAEWTVIMDVDEYWTALPPAPMMTMAAFLRTLPPAQRQYHFCAVDQECHRRPHSSVRPKSATRTGISAHECEPVVGLGHFSLPMAVDVGPPSRCWPHLGPNGSSSWASMEEHCLSALGPAPVLSYFLSHETGPELRPSAEEEQRLLREALENPEQRSCIKRGGPDETAAAALGRCTPQRTLNRLGGSWDEAVECRYNMLLAPERALYQPTVGERPRTASPAPQHVWRRRT